MVRLGRVTFLLVRVVSVRGCSVPVRRMGRNAPCLARVESRLVRLVSDSPESNSPESGFNKICAFDPFYPNIKKETRGEARGKNTKIDRALTYPSPSPLPIAIADPLLLVLFFFPCSSSRCCCSSASSRGFRRSSSSQS